MWIYRKYGFITKRFKNVCKVYGYSSKTAPIANTKWTTTDIKFRSKKVQPIKGRRNSMSIKVNYGGLEIIKPGYYGCPWWDGIMRTLLRKRKYNDKQVHAFLRLMDTLIRLELQGEGLWKGRNAR